MDWNSYISTGAAVVSAVAGVLSAVGGGVAYCQANLSSKAKAKAIEERKLAEQAEERAIRAADLAEERLKVMNEQTAALRDQEMRLEQIAEAVKSGSEALESVSSGPKLVYIDKIAKNRFVIINQKDVPLIIESVQNRKEFVKLSLEDKFEIQPRGQKKFSAIGAMQKPLPDNLVLDEIGQDQPLHLKLPQN